MLGLTEIDLTYHLLDLPLSARSRGTINPRHAWDRKEKIFTDH